VFSQGGTGWLDAKGAPGTDGLMLPMTFLPADSAALQTRAVGETVAVEVLTASQNQAALAPLAAVSAHHEVWVVEDGTARPVPVQIRGQNATHAAIDASLAGSRVILLPDEYALVPGCAVKEAGR